MFSFFLGLFVLFCRRHYRSVSFSACLVLVLVFMVSRYPSFLGRQSEMSIFGDFLPCSVQIKSESLYGASFFRIICSIGLSFAQSSLLLHLIQTL